MCRGGWGEGGKVVLTHRWRERVGVRREGGGEGCVGGWVGGCAEGSKDSNLG